jgi:phage gp16-like protein
MTVPAGTDPRRRMLAKLHCIKKQQGLDDDTYRHMLHLNTGQASAAKLTTAQLARVIVHLTGRYGPSRSTNEWAFIDTATPAYRALLRKVCALCRAMRVTKAYAEGTASRQAGTPRKIEMMNASELRLLVGALERTQKAKAKAQP